MTKTDEDIKADVVESMWRDARVDASDVAVEIDDGLARLSGTVPTYRSMWAAYDDALFTDGVVRVLNEIKVALKPGYGMPPDGEIAESADQILRWNADLDASNIEVAVRDGEATLMGTVPWFWHRETAEDMVSRLRGVKAVRNELAVVPTENVTDEVIADDIVAEMERTVLADPTQVVVNVTDGVVTLRGEVDSTLSSAGAATIARNAWGVKDVVNLLTLK